MDGGERKMTCDLVIILVVKGMEEGKQEEGQRPMTLRYHGQKKFRRGCRRRAFVQLLRLRYLLPVL
jgi:hypothetical protein